MWFIFLVFVSRCVGISIKPAQVRNSSGPEFSIVVNTFGRDQNLQRIINHYHTCGNIDLHVCWNEPERSPPQWLLQQEAQGTVVVDRNPAGGLTNRFKPRNFAADAVFSTDDDLIYSCRLLLNSFEMWTKRPDHLFGFGPRVMNKDDEESEYRRGEWMNAWKTGHTNVVLVTKGGFLHKRFYTEYFKPEYSEQRKIVDDALTGEDVMMAMVHAKTTGLAPVGLLVEKPYVRAGLQMLPAPNSLTTDAGVGLHTARSQGSRGVVSHQLNQAFGYPLIDSHDFFNALTKDIETHPDRRYSRFRVTESSRGRNQ